MDASKSSQFLAVVNKHFSREVFFSVQANSGKSLEEIIVAIRGYPLTTWTVEGEGINLMTILRHKLYL